MVSGKHDRLRGLYAVTPDWLETSRLVAAVRDAIAGGAALVQYRNKVADRRQKRRQASALAAICEASGVPLVINDDLAIALEIGTAGLHIGGDDGDPSAAKAKLGVGRLLGVSCYDQITRVDHAAASGADIVGIGAVYASATKPAAVRASLKLLREASSRGVIVAAIGGITLDKAQELICAGADLLAVLSDLFESPDIAARAADYAKLFATMEPRA